VIDGGEADDFDKLSATYILFVTGPSKVSNSARLVLATGAIMLERPFPQLVTSGKLDAHVAMIESSRFCVDTTIEEGRGRASLPGASDEIEWIFQCIAGRPNLCAQAAAFASDAFLFLMSLRAC
jgi:N-acyl-L-homoserine lactone synthetase